MGYQRFPAIHTLRDPLPSPAPDHRRVVEEMLLYVGGSIAYFQGDIRKLVDDIGALRPTIFAGVPRVFERIYNGVMDQVRTHACVWGLWVL